MTRELASARWETGVSGLIVLARDWAGPGAPPLLTPEEAAVLAQGLPEPARSAVVDYVLPLLADPACVHTLALFSQPVVLSKEARAWAEGGAFAPPPPHLSAHLQQSHNRYKLNVSE